MINENAILDIFYSHLDEMKLGDAFITTMEQFDDEDEAQQVFGELLLPTIIQAFAEKYDTFDDTDGDVDIQGMFEAFLTFENIPTKLGNIIAQTINDLAKEEAPLINLYLVRILWRLLRQSEPLKTQRSVRRTPMLTPKALVS